MEILGTAFLINNIYHKDSDEYFYLVFILTPSIRQATSLESWIPVRLDVK
jgi:hypothetical protein